MSLQSCIPAEDTGKLTEGAGKLHCLWFPEGLRKGRELELKPHEVTDMFREIAGAVRFFRTGYENVISGQPEQMSGGFIKLEALEQKDDLHASGMDMGCQGRFGLAGCLDSKG